MGNTNKCGQCNKQHTQKCWQTKACLVHQGICFSCRNCQTQTNLDTHCQVCKRKENHKNMFLHHECDMDQYLCNRQFIKKQYYKNILLPCSKHQISSDEYLNFMTNFCYQCGRMLVKDICQKPDISLCFACRKNAQLKDQKVQINSELNIQPIIPSQKNQQQNKAIECNLQKNTELEQKQKYQQTIDTQKKVIQLLESRISTYDFHLKQIRKIVGNQSQICQLCMVPYDSLSKTPYQICMAQHIVCKSCLEALDRLVDKKCPWCKEKIEREKLTPFPRLHKKIVEIQKVIQTTLAKLLQNYKQQNNQIDQKVKQKQQPQVQKKEKKHKIIKKQNDQTLIKIPKIKKQMKKVEKKKA